MENWYKITLYRLIEVCKTTASKYTRSKVRKALPSDYAYVIEELITEKAEVLDKEAYYDAIVNTIIEIGRAENFIIALAELIQRLVVTICIFWETFMTEAGSAFYYGQADELSFPGYSVGESRCGVDGGGSGTDSLHCHGHPKQSAIRESGYSGGRIRDQYDAAGDLCHGSLQE